MPTSSRGRRSSSATRDSCITPGTTARWSSGGNYRPRSEPCSYGRWRRPKTACRSQKTFRPERLWTTGITCASAGSRHWRPWPRAFWRPGRKTCQARIAIRSWCTSMPRPSRTPTRAAASSSVALRSHRRPRGALPAMPASYGSSRTREVSRWMWAERPARSRPRSAGLNSRDKGCRFPGCSFKRYVDGHHVKHWAEGGETKLSNLVTLCRFHHRLVHEGQVVVQTLDDGAFRFIRPDGQTFESPLPPCADWHDLVAMNESADIQVTPRTAITRWTGESLGLDVAVGWLMENANRQKSASAETSA